MRGLKWFENHLRGDSDYYLMAFSNGSNTLLQNSAFILLAIGIKRDNYHHDTTIYIFVC